MVKLCRRLVVAGGQAVTLALLIVLGLSGCTAALVPPAPVTERVVAPTFTPTTAPLTTEPPAVAMAAPQAAVTPQAPVAPADAGASSAAVDAQGFDIAEQRVIDVYRRVSPAVVSITTQVLRRDFFYNAVPEAGSGSGFVFDRDGHILTNYHVVEGAQRIEVYFGDDVVYPADIVGVDPRNDIALIKVDAPADLLVPVELGNSANLVVGQRAISIGNPFGQFGRTLTTGVISALGRTLEGQDGRTITGVIQTDAAINRGNSGGPLLDSSGRVIGINSAIFSPTGTNAGVGFAVPVDPVRRLLPDLLTLGRYRHPWLGIRYAYAITPGLAETLKLPVSQGLLLVQLYDGSPLMDADLHGAQSEAIVGNQRVYIGGDVITSVADEPVTSLSQLESFLEDNYRVGDSVQVTYVRGGQSSTLTVELGEEPN